MICHLATINSSVKANHIQNVMSDNLIASRDEVIISNIPASYILQFSYKSLTFHWKIVDDETHKLNDESTMYYE